MLHQRRQDAAVPQGRADRGFPQHPEPLPDGEQPRSGGGQRDDPGERLWRAVNLIGATPDPDCRRTLGFRTTIPSRKPCSAQSSTGPSTQAGRSPAKRRPASGWRLLWTVTTTDTTTAGSGSSRPISVTAAPPPPSASSAFIPTRKSVRNIRAVGAEPRAAGASKRWCGSTSHQKSRRRLWRYL